MTLSAHAGGAGEVIRCPHCTNVARVTPRGEGKWLQWVCSACGGPRLPVGVSSTAANASLKEAQTAQLFARRLRVSALFLSLATLFITLFGLAVAPGGAVARVILLAAELAPLFLALRARRRANRISKKADEAIERAWLAASEDIAKEQKTGVTVAELAARLKVEPARAEALLTELTVHDRTRIDVDDEAEIRYSAGSESSGGATRVRIDAPEDRFRALEAAYAEADELRTIELDEAGERAVLSDPFPNSRRR